MPVRPEDADRVPVIDLELAEWHKVMNVNLNGTFYMSRAFGRRLVEQGRGGCIINISSVGGKLMAGYDGRVFGIEGRYSRADVCHG